MTGSTPSPEPMAVSRAQMGRTGPPMSYARGPTRQRGRRRSSRPDRRREPERCIALEPDLRDRVRIEGTDSGRIRVVWATGSGTNCLRRARLFIASRNREQPIRMVTRSVIPSETAKYAAPNSRWTASPVLGLTDTRCCGCGPEGIRTPDLVSAIHARSQLRHGPTSPGERPV